MFGGKAGLVEILSQSMTRLISLLFIKLCQTDQPPPPQSPPLTSGALLPELLCHEMERGLYIYE